MIAGILLPSDTKASYNTSSVTHKSHKFIKLQNYLVYCWRFGNQCCLYLAKIWTNGWWHV